MTKANPVALAGLDPDVMARLFRGRSDPVWWAEHFLGIRLHRGQRRWLRACARRAEDGWSPAFINTAVAAGNRAGKTLALAILVLHHCFYKLGVRPPAALDAEDTMRWVRAPYVWYHIAIQQEVAELVYNELVLIFQGSHPAQQGRGCRLVNELGPVFSYDKKFRGEYLWIRVHPLFGGAEIHFRTSQEKAKALLGKDMNGISFDEAAFEPYLMLIKNEVLQLRRLSTGGPLHFISTGTEGYNAFADVWAEGDPENPERHPKTASFRMSTRDNIGYGITQQAFDDIVAGMPEYLIPQNIDGHFIEAQDAYFNAQKVEEVFDSSLPAETQPEKGHAYVNGVDPGIAADATWSLTLDYSARVRLLGVRARRSRGRQALPAIVNMVREGHLLYSENGSRCITAVDSTGLGGKMFKQEFSIIRPLRDFDFAGTKAKKLELLSDLKAVIDRGELKLPKSGLWLEVRRQLLGYKLDDKHLEQDAVMALAIAVRIALRHPANPVANPTLDFFGALSA